MFQIYLTSYACLSTICPWIYWISEMKNLALNILKKKNHWKLIEKIWKLSKWSDGPNFNIRVKSNQEFDGRWILFLQQQWINNQILACWYPTLYNLGCQIFMEVLAVEPILVCLWKSLVPFFLSAQHNCTLLCMPRHKAQCAWFPIYFFRCL